MVGTLLNAAGILIGGIAGLAARRQFSPAVQTYFKTTLGAACVLFGFYLVWLNINGSFLQVFEQLFIALLALMLGRLAGRLLRLQKTSNRIGEFARVRMTGAAAGKQPRWSDGFNTCSLLFCAAPLAVLGAVQDGLSGYFQPLIVKAVMDGLAAMSLAAMFGWGVVLSALPVMMWQGTITLLCAQYARPFLEQHGLLNSVNVTGGLLVVFVSLVIFQVRKIELADYLPALAFAPLLTWLWR